MPYLRSLKVVLSGSISISPPGKILCSMIEKVGIHPLSVEDCFDEEQVPKIEYFMNNTFIIFNSFSYTKRYPFH